MSRPLRVAVAGAGPAGLYAAGHLLEGPGGTYLDGRLQTLVDSPVEVDVFDALPTPGGLVRYGVAPDHPEKKLVQEVFDRIAARRGFRFFGNVEVGNHVRAEELSDWYDAVIYAHGAAGDKPLGIPGEELPGCLSARSFVAWYNGHPDYQHLDPDLSHERVVVVGNGNVALDVARILARPVHTLAGTDIADHALDALWHSKVREVVVLGRRAHFHGAFNNPELEELGNLPDVDIAVEHGDLPDGHDSVLDDLDAETLRKVRTLARYAQTAGRGCSRRIVLRFLSSPIEIVGVHRVEAVLVGQNRLCRDDANAVSIISGAESELLTAGLVLTATGYFGIPLPGISFDSRTGTVEHTGGRVVHAGKAVPGLYVTGWAKRGPRGIIGTNKKCARDTVRCLLDDARAGRLRNAGTLDSGAVHDLLSRRQPDLVDRHGWLQIDDSERRAGRLDERPRIKISSRKVLLDTAARQLSPAT